MHDSGIESDANHKKENSSVGPTCVEVDHPPGTDGGADVTGEIPAVPTHPQVSSHEIRGSQGDGQQGRDRGGICIDQMLRYRAQRAIASNHDRRSRAGREMIFGKRLGVIDVDLNAISIGVETMLELTGHHHAHPSSGNRIGKYQNVFHDRHEPPRWYSMSNRDLFAPNRRIKMDNQPLKVGEMAPDFELMDQDKNKVKLSDFRGKKKVVLLFYPMDFSPVCTTEFCAFGPEIDKLQDGAQATVFGVSCDSPFSHAAFRKQYAIPHSLLADPTRKMAKAYGMWAGEEPYNCTKRGTVVIDKDGKIGFYQEVPMREPRNVEELEQIIAES